MVAWWTFDEGNGTTVTDYMNGYVGDIINSMDGNISFDNTVSKFGYALRFPKNAWVNTNAFPASMGIADNNPRAISFWMYAEDHGGANNRDTQTGIYGMGRRSNASNSHWMWGMRGLWDTANYRRIFSQHWGWDPQIYIPQGVKNKWVHILHQYTGSRVQAYVNGVRRLMNRGQTLKREMFFLCNSVDLLRSPGMIEHLKDYWMIFGCTIHLYPPLILIPFIIQVMEILI